MLDPAISVNSVEENTRSCLMFVFYAISCPICVFCGRNF